MDENSYRHLDIHTLTHTHTHFLSLYHTHTICFRLITWNHWRTDMFAFFSRIIITCPAFFLFNTQTKKQDNYQDYLFVPERVAVQLWFSLIVFSSFVSYYHSLGHSVSLFLCFRCWMSVWKLLQHIITRMFTCPHCNHIIVSCQGTQLGLALQSAAYLPCRLYDIKIVPAHSVKISLSLILKAVTCCLIILLKSLL